MIRTFTNTAMRNSDKMIVSRYRKIKILDHDKSDDPRSNIDKLGNSEIHSAVGSKDNDYLLLFNRFDLIKMRIDKQD